MLDNDTIQYAHGAVAQGAVWLDENHPGWASRLDLTKLEMSKCSVCVIGQAVVEMTDKVFGFYDVVEEAAADDPNYGEHMGDSWSADHGFQDPGLFDDGEGNYDVKLEKAYYNLLEHLWAKEAVKRIPGL